MAQQKVSFKKWWKNITGTKATKGLFHIDLVDSIVYAGVPVHYTVNGQTRCQGYIPTIVSKCGWFLKEQATRTRGIFRVSGSAKRVSELQLIFDTPPKYGSQLEWTGYTIHDASNVLRRYLNHLPDPVITLEYYEKFRDVHRNLTDEDEQIAAYQELISKLPPPHSCLLMYLLDLLALFAHHSEENLMDSKNLASVFQPGVLSHPNHSMSPGEYMTSAAVLKFLIDHQSSFTMPRPNIDEEDEEMANFGLLNQSNPPNQHLIPVQANAYHGGGYVNASDHERIHRTMMDRGVSFEAEDAVHILNSGVRRQLSLQKPIIPNSTLPGNPPQRSKSTNSSTSSHHSNSGLSGFLARRRSHRNSKTGSKIISESEAYQSLHAVAQDQDLSDIPENPRSGSDSKSGSLTPRSSSIRKAATSPLIGSEESNAEFSTYLSRRKQLKAEGVHREPSIFCQTIEIQFQAPVIDSIGGRGDGAGPQIAPFRPTAPMYLPSGSSSPSQPTVSSRMGDRSSQNMGELSSARDRLSRPLASTTAHVHIPDIAVRPQQHQRDSSTGYPGPQQQQQQRSSPGQRRTSNTVQNLHPQSLAGSSASAEYNAAASQRPVNSGMPISRAKSNPGDLTSVGPRNPSYPAAGMQGSHGGGGGGSGNQAIEKFKGLFTGKNRDQHYDSGNASPRDASTIGGEIKDGRKRESLTKEKQRKYKSQEVTPSHLQQGTTSSSSSASGPGGWRGAPAYSTINEHEGAYMRPPPQRPHMPHSSSSPPQRPAPPPPEGSLMDLLDPPQRLGGYKSGHSSPSGGSRSASPARTPSSTRHGLPANNASFTSTTSSSARSTSSTDRLYHGRGGLPSQGSSSSLDIMIPGSEDGHPVNSGGHPRQRSPRPGHSPDTGAYPHNQFHPDHHQLQHHHQQQSQQHLSPYGPSHRQNVQPHATYSPNPGYEHGGGGGGGHRPYDTLPPSQQQHLASSSPRSRQGSFGSNSDAATGAGGYDSSSYVPPAPAPKSRDRRLPSREGSSSSGLRGGDATPPRARSNSSKNSSPIHSPALTPSLSRNTSSHQQQQQQQQSGQIQHHGPSPLASGQGQGQSQGLGQGANYVSPPPSSRARSRAQSRDEQHYLQRQESATSHVSSSAAGHSGSRPAYYERERSRSGAGAGLISATTSSPSSPALLPFHGANHGGGNHNNSNVSLASSNSTTTRSIRSGRLAQQQTQQQQQQPPPPL